MEVLFFIVVGGLLVAAALIQRQLKLRRRQQLMGVAARMGLAFSETDLISPYRTLDLPFSLFQKGDGRGVENVMWGPVGELPVRLFDYWYYDESSDSEGRRSRTYHRFTCALTEIDAGCPPLVIGRENALGRLGDHLGFRDVEFESEEFNRRFEIHCKDERFAFAFIDAGMIDWLLSLPGRSTFEVVGKWIVAASPKLDPARWWDVLGLARDLRSHVPAVVRTLYPCS